MMRKGNAAVFALSLLSLALATCSVESPILEEANAETDASKPNARAGAMAVKALGCGTCHVIPGISGANGVVGPPLNQIARRVYLAGLLRNTPDNMMMWLRDPQSILPGNAMPNMQLTEEQVRDITAYLGTLK
jgi:cytochrome c1